MKKETLIQLIIIFILSIILIVLVNLTIKEMNARNNMMFRKNFMEEEIVKETSKDDVEIGKKVNTEIIKLDEYDSNVTIDKAGEYTIEGSFNYSVIVDSTEKVILNLNNVSINSDITAAIGNKGTGELVINMLEGTTNILMDNGSSELDGCIYSSGNLTIEGTGKLEVYGNQEEGEGIATTDANITINGGEIYIECNDDGINAGGDKGGMITINDGNIMVKASGDGIDSNKDLIINGGKIYTVGSSKGGDAGIDTDGKFEINGGEIIAIGSDMLQNPDNNSKQKYISFTLNSVITNGSKISLKDIYENEVISFEAKEDFKTLIISSSLLKDSTYYLYIDNEKTEYSKSIK